MKLGVVIMLADSRELGRPRRYREIRAMAQQVEGAGFDSIWLYDHLLYREAGEGTTGIWECWSMLSALAEATQRVELGTLVICNTFRNPALLAKMAITVDEISGGRLILGMGAGWNEPEYRAFGFPFDHRVDRFEEALQIVRPLLKEGRVDFQGKYYQAEECEIAPLGPRQLAGEPQARPAAARRGAPQVKEGPALMVASMGPRMLRLAARYADLWNVTYLGQPETLLKPRQALWDACAEVGRDPASLPVTAVVLVAYPELMGGRPVPEFDNGSLSGSPEEIAAGLRVYEQLGVEHLMIHLVPYLPQSLELMTAALKIYRGEGYQPSVIG
jgi:alkanesulfonate monooxygenase SsuD/methylene tetrahydromethanopterin reductase-like flavin-dependent oxidoreductase (luciferase family)